MNYITWFLLAIAVVIVLAKILVPNTREYVCPKCNKTFVPESSQLARTIHVGSKHMLTCPHCGEHSMMSPAPKKS